MGLFTKFNFPWHIFTTHRVAFTFYVLFTLFTLAAGVVMSGLSLMWLYPYTTETFTGMSISTVPTTSPIAPNSLNKLSLTEAVSYLNLVLTTTDITIALILGVLSCITFFISLPAYMSRSTTGLIYLNLLLPLESLGFVGGTGFIWFRSLRERNEFWGLWQNGGLSVQYAIQEKFQCCGYWDTSSAPSGSSCAAVVPAIQPCVNPFQDYADPLLEGVTAFMFFVAIVMAVWILVNLCLIAERNLNERFRLIDEKAKYKSMYFV